MYKTIYIFTFIFVLISSIALAIPPFETQIISGGMEIQYINREIIGQGSDFELNLHVFNKTNGISLTNETTDCNLDFYNVNGSHLMSNKLIFESSSNDYKLIIGSGNFSNIGFHNYIIQCNSSSMQLGGAVSGTLKVTKTDIVLDIPLIILYGLIIAIILGFIFVAIYGMWKTGLVGKSLYLILLHTFLIALFFTLFDLTDKFTTAAFLTWFLRFCFLFMYWTFIPFLFLIFGFMIVQLRKARGVQELIDKGIPEDEAIKRIMRRK